MIELHGQIAKNTEQLAGMKELQRRTLLASQRSLSLAEVAADHNYLAVITNRVRDHSDDKRIFGLVIDRQVISKIFSGAVIVVYVVLKQFFDQVIRNGMAFAPPGFGTDDQRCDDTDYECLRSVSGDTCALDQSGLKLLQDMAKSMFNSSCTYNLTVTGVVDVSP